MLQNYQCPAEALIGISALLEWALHLHNGITAQKDPMVSCIHYLIFVLWWKIVHLWCFKNVPQGTVITDTEENQNNQWFHSYTVVKICRKIKIVRISRTMLCFLKRKADISLKPNYLLVYLCSLLCMSYCLSWDLSWIKIPHFQAKEHKTRGKELTELRAVSPAGGVAVLTFPQVRHCPVTCWQVTCFDARQDKGEGQNKSTNHWPSIMGHNGSSIH